MTLIFETDSTTTKTGFKIVTERGKNRFCEYVADICINYVFRYGRIATMCERQEITPKLCW